MKGRNGFTLAEILVALSVLQLGLLGTVGSLVLASAVLSQARDLEWAVHEARGLADSIAHHGAAGGGTRTLALGHMEWVPATTGRLAEVRILVWRNGDSERPLVDVATLVLTAPPAGP